jgi:hypothetical protein
LKRATLKIYPFLHLILPVLTLVIGIFLLSSCGPEENPQVDIHDPEIQVIEINTSNQSGHFYSLAQKKTIASFSMNDWDLKFCSQNDKFYIYQNTAKNMRIARYDGKFSDPISAQTGFAWKKDIVKEGKEITAMGSWGDFSFLNPKSYGYTYILDLGYINYVNEFGYRKIQVLGCSNNIYTIRIGQLDDPVGDTLKIEKRQELSYVYFSFKNRGKVVDIEPQNNDWDLLFTQYGLSKPIVKDSLTVDTSYSHTDYIILNTAGRVIACDTARSFDKITFWDAEKYTYHSAFNYIGNRWRYLNTNNNNYDLSNWRVFIIRDTKNHIYKIEFKSIQKTSSGYTRIEFKVKNL